jgi:transglutaminase-like putative cysteine protease
MAKKKFNPPRWWDWLAAILGLVILQIAAGRLVATRWTEHLALVQIVSFFGIILGLALGQSIFSKFISGSFAISYGCFVIPWQLGLTLDQGINWPERLLSMQGRLELVLRELVNRDPVTDNLLFLLLMAFLFWVLSVFTGYILTRHANTWSAVLPGGVVAFVIHTFDPLLTKRSWYLAFYLFFALLLVARLVFIKNREIWKRHHMHTPPDIGFDLARFAAFVAMVIVLFAWNIPVLAATFKPAAEILRSSTRPWLTLQDRMSFAFASLRASVGLVSDLYGDTLPLGLGTPLSDQVLMEVEAPSVPPQGVRYYWRAWVYSIYSDNEWMSNIQDTREMIPGGRDLTQPGLDVRAVANFTFFPHDSISLLYVAPQPLWVSRPANATMVTNPDGTIDLGSIQVNEYIRPGEQYEVRSSLSSVTILDLREAGTEYPQWVLDRYLQIPAEITPRTRELAQRLAQGYDTPYDIVASVTNFLRENITYQQTIDIPPSNAERIDWFLFEYQKGFCYYYASSEVILLRSLGIPARIAVGFAQGERKSPPIVGPQTRPGEPEAPDTQFGDTVTYIVRQNDAHAWPEVYFPGIGWVEFEPTSGQDPLFRPSGEDYPRQQPQNQNPELSRTDPLADLEDKPDDVSSSIENAGSWLAFWTGGRIFQSVILLIALALLIFVIIQTRRGKLLSPVLERIAVQFPTLLERGLRRLGIQPPAFLRNWVFLANLPPLSKAYLEINRSLTRLGKKAQLDETPAERVSALIALLPQVRNPAYQLLHEYQRGAYSQHFADSEAARIASGEVRKQSYLALLKRFLARFQEPERNLPKS